MGKKIYSVKEKKVLRWANGFGVFITTEAKKFGWTDKTKLLVSAIEDSEEKKIVIIKVKE
ncbi:MAG: hypothetical protein WC613_04995 [Candidatus Aenigmatarchaeota archaeon]